MNDVPVLVLVGIFGFLIGWGLRGPAHTLYFLKTLDEIKQSIER